MTSEVKAEIRQNGRFTTAEVEALLGQLTDESVMDKLEQVEREFGEE